MKTSKWLIHVMTVMVLFFMFSELGVAAVLEVGGSKPYSTIQSAINDANDLDTVIVDDGVYTGLGNRDIDYGGKAITVRSLNGPSACIIDCSSDPNHLHRGFYFHTSEDENSILDGFTIRNGQEEYGGGIYCDGSSPLIQNCIFYNNLAYKMDEFVTLGDGGAVSFNSGSTAKIKNCTFYSNSAYFGGNAIGVRESVPIIESCTC